MITGPALVVGTGQGIAARPDEGIAVVVGNGLVTARRGQGSEDQDRKAARDEVREAGRGAGLAAAPPGPDRGEPLELGTEGHGRDTLRAALKRAKREGRVIWQQGEKRAHLHCIAPEGVTVTP